MSSPSHHAAASHTGGGYNSRAAGGSDCQRYSSSLGSTAHTSPAAAGTPPFPSYIAPPRPPHSGRCSTSNSSAAGDGKPSPASASASATAAEESASAAKSAFSSAPAGPLDAAGVAAAAAARDFSAAVPVTANAAPAGAATPLAGAASLLPPPPLRERLEAHMRREVDRHWVDILLLLSHIATGLLDSGALLRWGTFVSMQTGNTVYLGLGLVDMAVSRRWAKSLVALVSFCAGASCFGVAARHFPPRARWVLVGSYALQAALIGAAAAIVSTDTAPVRSETRWQVMVPIALIAFQSSAQIMVSRAFKYGAFSGVALTGMFYDFFSDPKLFEMHHTERNRRAAAPFLLLFGVLIAGKYLHDTNDLAAVLLTAMAIKCVITVALLAWRGVKAAEATVETSDAATEVVAMIPVAGSAALQSPFWSAGTTITNGSNNNNNTNNNNSTNNNNNTNASAAAADRRVSSTTSANPSASVRLVYTSPVCAYPPSSPT